MKAIIREDDQAVSPVIATILMVAITVVLAAVLYVMVSGLLVSPGTNKPVMSFNTPALDAAGNASILVASASQAQAPANYRVNLAVGGVAGVAVSMPTTSGAFASVVVSGTTYRIYWTDIGGDVTVNGGDSFRITGNGVTLPAGSFEFFLLWSDGSLVQQAQWTK